MSRTIKNVETDIKESKSSDVCGLQIPALGVCWEHGRNCGLAGETAVCGRRRRVEGKAGGVPELCKSIHTGSDQGSACSECSRCQIRYLQKMYFVGCDFIIIILDFLGLAGSIFVFIASW